MNKRVFIILLNYNGAVDTIDCIHSLERIDYDNYKIVVVDNESTDKSVSLIKKAIGNKHIFMSSGKNGGFAYGNNVGIRYALEQGAEYILLINTDTLVEPDFLSKLVGAAEEHPEAGLVTGRILYEGNRDKIWYGGGEINWKRFYGSHYQGENTEDKGGLRKVTFATGCLMLIKAEVFDKAGFLPEEYFMYYEDVDFCAMIQEQGFTILYEPSAVIYHKVSASSGEEESAFAVEWNTRNRIRFIRKYKKRINFLSYIKLMLFFYITRIGKIAGYISKGRIDKVKALIKGVNFIFYNH
ncbi:glycosyltransferase family 2 protein [Clostridium thermarum]|uniref:glycosyltransferase family 2 protein n=1 Tax=Clostridium thermarum TaxID=1716543 RepID=UPI00111CD140|nr:glycosyltransferase family 2 protein [Clostridium thermarum]